MASSRKSKASKKAGGAALQERVAGALGGVVGAGERIVLGLSGGVDSVVLLDLLAHLAPKLRFKLSALHINHQLSPNAPRWARFCRALCRARKIPLRVAKVTVPRGNSVEAAARAARHAVFRQLNAQYIALAHNQDDQAETLLLQLLRGAGVKGLAAMPFIGELKSVRAELVEARTRRTAGPVILRPLLDVPRSEIEAYARQRELQWIEDESNAETYFLRNFLRHEVLPQIERRYPAYRTTLSRSARHFADAAALLDELGAADAAGQVENGTLSMTALRRLSPPRARNLLRCFLAMHHHTMPADRLDETLRQVLTAKQDARVLVQLEGAQLRRFAGRLHVVRDAWPFAAHVIEWHGEREMALPEFGGTLEFARGRDTGISLARLRGRKVTIGVRRGGERMQPDCRRPRRSLKNLLQEARIPPWQRERTPLIFCDGELVWAAGVGVDCRYRSTANEPSLLPAWRLCA
jgi:tRNA(Ile)-lysidine synthase